MEIMMKEKLTEKNAENTMIKETFSLQEKIDKSWAKIAPFWPLKNLIAVNPIAGFEDLPFEEAFKQAQAFFQQKDLPKKMEDVNRQTIKFLQAFFDEGQATIQMPGKDLGLLRSVLSLIRFDEQIHQDSVSKKEWLRDLPQDSQAMIEHILLCLSIPKNDQQIFLTLMLTTLPGWAAYVRYLENWAGDEDRQSSKAMQEEFLALRLVLTFLLWPEAYELVFWHYGALKNADVAKIYHEISINETIFRSELISKFKEFKQPVNEAAAKAQLVFCIDVRSEPFRKALEAQNDYETFGFAGFFGVPVSIENVVTENSHASCPVLLKPMHHILEAPECSLKKCQTEHQRFQMFKRLYQSLKYTFTTPFSLVEVIGFLSAVWMGVRNFLPKMTDFAQALLKNAIAPKFKTNLDLEEISLDEQIAYGEGALKTMGMTENFAPLVVFCGHGSSTQNNAYASALDCGACGGRHGGANARILAEILNCEKVRMALVEKGIIIPSQALFLGAEHNTTTDEVEIFMEDGCEDFKEEIQQLKKDLQKARDENSLWRAGNMDVLTNVDNAASVTSARAIDWAQVRPEWGLAQNAAFIVGPRWLTKNVDLQGRSFLHSYDWKKDAGGEALTAILTAPMVVAQWINAQYFFSSLDNVAFGGGSKITKNITGKIGIMQGNASDLMNGLPLQSVYKSDDEAYHRPLRLTVMIHAPQSKISAIIKEQEILQKLFGNGWLHVICYDPETGQKLSLQRDFSWNLV